MPETVIFLLGAALGAAVAWLFARATPRAGAPPNPSPAETQARPLPEAPRAQRMDTPEVPPPQPLWSVPAAIDPGTLPPTFTPGDVAAGRTANIPSENLRRLLDLLPSWKPNRHGEESGYQKSFESHLRKHAFDYERHPRVDWSALKAMGRLEPLASDPYERKAIPDFLVQHDVLVEIKREILDSSTADRAVGQMMRYLLAHRTRGPALLLVCDDYNENLKALVEIDVAMWRALDVPVLAYFVRAPAGALSSYEYRHSSTPASITRTVSDPAPASAVGGDASSPSAAVFEGSGTMVNEPAAYCTTCMQSFTLAGPDAPIRCPRCGSHDLRVGWRWCAACQEEYVVVKDAHHCGRPNELNEVIVSDVAGQQGQ